MQIVIDIDFRAYNKCLKLVDDNDGGILGMHLINAVANGTPLTKGHGDLIDRSDLLKREVWGTFGETGYDAPCIFKTEVNDAPTIIEADKEVNE